MSSRKKNLISWIVKSLLVFIFLVVVIMVFTPRLINLAMVKRNIKETVSESLGGRITYSNLKLSYFPRPHVLIHKAEIAIPDSFTITIFNNKIGDCCIVHLLKRDRRKESPAQPPRVTVAGVIDPAPDRRQFVLGQPRFVGAVQAVINPVAIH